MHKITLIVLLLVMHSGLIAQKEGNIWYFGKKAGLDFNSGKPKALTDGAMSTNEGCASIADSTGKLLFYTDGSIIYNKNHVTMQNGVGLTGSYTSTQSAVIIKKPYSDNIYYVFTIDAQLGPGGFRYSEVDMTLAGGLGAVNPNKNILLDEQTCEKIAAIKHLNDVDFWIVIHLFASNTFHSYRLTPLGLDTVPVISKVGSVISGNDQNTIGYMKGNQDGTKIAMANTFMNNMELFDFNNQSGKLSNAMSFGGYLSTGAYGIEFSPNNRFLYVSFGQMPGRVYQYDLSSGSQTTIDNTKRIISKGNINHGGALQIGPDRKIYHSEITNNSIGVIEYPDSLGLACDYKYNFVSLDGAEAQFGLPTFYNSIHAGPALNFTFSNACSGDSTQFRIKNQVSDSVLWNFGDPKSGINNYSILSKPKHLYSDTGTYEVKLISIIKSKRVTTTQTVRIHNHPEVFIGNDTAICIGKTVVLDATTAGATYKWYNGETGPTLNAIATGNYWVEITVNGCHGHDTAFIEVIPRPWADFGNDTTICHGEVLALDATNPHGHYVWHDGSTNAVFAAAQQTQYAVFVYNVCGYHYDTINVELTNCHCPLFLPNAFTPNDDALNDYFAPKFDCLLSHYSLRIFNRLGAMVFFSNDSEQKWDGQYQGNPPMEGVYPYVLTYKTNYQNFTTMRGSITLLR